jgi:IS4 transposase
MILEPIFERFVADSPLSVMARATIEHALPASLLDDLFDRTAESGYTRELLFSSLVDLVSLVVTGSAPAVQAAFQRQRDRLPVTLKSVYEKLQRVEPIVCREMVRAVSRRCRNLIDELAGDGTTACTGAPLLAGHAVKILDGNHLAATQRRLKVTRGHTAGPLPGQVLAVLDPDARQVLDVVPCEDAYAQERALIEHLHDSADQGDVWIAGRNFCTVDWLSELRRRQAFFVVRRHGNLTVVPQGEYGEEVETETGWVSERQVTAYRDGQEGFSCRQVRVRLKKPTEEGDRQIELLSNLPKEEADAVKVAELYQNRWRVENAFQELTDYLGCEVDTLGYPRAALFCFCVAVLAYGVQSVLEAALRSVHGQDKVDGEVSGYYVAQELSGVYAGMMIAIPSPHWEQFRDMPASRLAALLRGLAARVKLERFEKHPRKPTKKPTPKVRDDGPHLSTARLLDQNKRFK